MSIEDVSSALNVSTATIRNWIRLGHLHQISRGCISKSSLKEFQDNILGTEKLLTRANKSYADNHDHEALKKSFFDRLDNPSINFEESWIDEYQSSLSNSYRNKEGVYYTPEDIAADFFSFLPEDVSDLVFCDPCCGGGVFLQAAIDHGFRPENVYGFDIDEVAVSLTKKRLAKYEEVNVEVRDFLSLAEMDAFQTPKPDIIFTNPPWGKKLTKKRQQDIAKSLNISGNHDSCALFFLASLNILKDKGFLGMLLPDSFFNVASFETSRQQALSQFMIKLTDYGKPFKGLLTKAKGIIIQKRDFEGSGLVDCVPQKKGRHVRKQAEFSSNPKSIINFNCSPSEAEAIALINRNQHITLKGYAKWALGIVTGNNKKFIQYRSADNYIPVYKGSEIHSHKLDPPTCYIPNNFALYQQTPPRDMFLAPEKLVYKFISSNLTFYLDKGQRYFLNSANMLILKKDFPLSGKFMSEYLSSDFVNWYFRSIFETNKILRSDIESIPIFPQFTLNKDSFSESRLIANLGIERSTDGTYRVKE